MSFTQNYQQGVKNYYLSVGDAYVNPHRNAIQSLIKDKCLQYKTVLDLAAGTGEVTLALPQSQVTGVEPFLTTAYIKNTKCPCLPLLFEDIAEGKLKGCWEAVVCSYALHLVEDSWLPRILYSLAAISSNLYVISPHKKPFINHFCWELKEYLIRDRVHLRHFKNNLK